VELELPGGIFRLKISHMARSPGLLQLSLGPQALPPSNPSTWLSSTYTEDWAEGHQSQPSSAGWHSPATLIELTLSLLEPQVGVLAQSSCPQMLKCLIQDGARLSVHFKSPLVCL
jgi:hypothetical protein